MAKYLKLYRKIIDSDVWVTKPAWWIKVWIYILTRVTNDGVSKMPNGTTTLTCGCIYKDCRLSNDGVSVSAIEDVIEWLVLVNQIKAEHTTRGIVISVVNYEKYQGDTKEDANIARIKSMSEDVIEYLNLKSGSSFQCSTSAMRHISARIREGFTLDDFKKVIDAKVRDWSGSEMAEYIRPRTLFGTKFDGYLQSARRGIKKKYSRYDTRQLQV